MSEPIHMLRADRSGPMCSAGAGYTGLCASDPRKATCRACVAAVLEALTEVDRLRIEVERLRDRLARIRRLATREPELITAGVIEGLTEEVLS